MWMAYGDLLAFVDCWYSVHTEVETGMGCCSKVGECGDVPAGHGIDAELEVGIDLQTASIDHGDGSDRP
jgi:hypothetical protein